MHTPDEAVYLKDLENLALWFTAFILDIKPGETFKVRRYRVAVIKALQSTVELFYKYF
jgi:hypothetical protein